MVSKSGADGFDRDFHRKKARAAGGHLRPKALIPQDVDVSVSGDTLTIRGSSEGQSDEPNQESDGREASYVAFEGSGALLR